MADLEEHIAIKSHLEMCFSVLYNYHWLLDSYVLDFFLERHWEKLPGNWRNCIQHIPIKEFYYLLNLSVKTEIVWPLSLISLRVLVQFLQLPRKPKIHDIFLMRLNDLDCTELYKINKKPFTFEHPKLNNCFLKHVKPKKRYEIFKMATTIAELANKLNVKYIVDVGSGLGHLSRILAYGFDLNVCSIEIQPQLTKQAHVIDCEFEKIASKYLNDVELRELKNRRPVHLNQTIRSDLSVEDLVNVSFFGDLQKFKVVKEAFSLSETAFKFGIVGLHPCGDLATILLQLYANCPEAKLITLVGCCYHKLSSSSNKEQNLGFPLSQYFLFQSQERRISQEARALACHANESYCKRLTSNNYNHLKVHCYRAALENIVYKNWPKYRKSALTNVKYRPELTFSKYCETALKKLGLVAAEEDLNSEDTLKNLSRWEDVVKFYSLRLMLAPLIETVILLDRKLFLLEKGFQCAITATFEPEISPRNQLLISYKIK